MAAKKRRKVKRPPSVMTADDKRGRRAAYVRVPVDAETTDALEQLVTTASDLFRAAAGAFAALERESRRFRRR